MIFPQGLLEVQYLLGGIFLPLPNYWASNQNPNQNRTEKQKDILCKTESAIRVVSIQVKNLYELTFLDKRIIDKRQFDKRQLLQIKDNFCRGFAENNSCKS